MEATHGEWKGSPATMGVDYGSSYGFRLVVNFAQKCLEESLTRVFFGVTLGGLFDFYAWSMIKVQGHVQKYVGWSHAEDLVFNFLHVQWEICKQQSFQMLRQPHVE